MKQGNYMSQRSKQEYFQTMYLRYRQATAAEKEKLLDELCRVCGYHRKHAIRKLHQSLPEPRRRTVTPRGVTYLPQTISILTAVWEAAGYPWSLRLKALLPLWMPWIKHHFRVTARIEQQLLQISPRQIDRRLQGHKRTLRKRLYGRTKPGTLLKHQIPIRTTHWDVTTPGYVEIDLVAHSGKSARGEYIFSLNLTDIFTGWVETRAVMGKGQKAVVAALGELCAALPFELKGLDSDNGSEFINAHLLHFCQQRGIQFTRGRPYKKDDNAHIEQKNWTHVRRLMGWERYDTPRALAAMNAFYAGPWRTMMNLFQPCIKLQKKIRKGSRLIRSYDVPQTPLDRLHAFPQVRTAPLTQQRRTCDPFALAHTIECQIEAIWDLANPRYSPGTAIG
jgi:transposase InsO family protein